MVRAYAVAAVLVLPLLAVSAWGGFRVAPSDAVLAAILARLLGGVVPERVTRGRNVPVLNGFIIAMVGLLVFASLPQNKGMLPVLPADKPGLFIPGVPVAVGEYLRSHDPPATGKMLNDQAWGGYL